MQIQLNYLNNLSLIYNNKIDFIFNFKPVQKSFFGNQPLFFIASSLLRSVQQQNYYLTIMQANS